MGKDTMDKNPQPPSKDDKMPPAGPHARPDLIDQDKTPGTGILPSPDDDETPMQPTG